MLPREAILMPGWRCNLTICGRWLQLALLLASGGVVHAVTQDSASGLQLGLTPTLPEPVDQGREKCDVRDWGAIGDGEHDDTDAISRCWQECPSEVVHVPSGTYVIAQLELTGANKTLHLLEGSSLVAASERDLYGARQEDWYALVLRDCTGCAILGHGSATIDGRARDWVTGWAPGLEGDRKVVTNWQDPSCSRPPQCRPRLLGIRNSDFIHVSSLFINDSIFWTLHIVNSSHVSLSDLKIRGDPGIPNNDGIDVDSSEHVSISRIDVDTADDALCIKTTEPGRPTAHVAVKGAVLASRSAALKFGSESVADMYNVTISDVEIRPSHRAIGVQLRDGGNMSAITVRDVKLTARWDAWDWWGAAEAIVISRLRRETDQTAIGALRNMTLRNVSGVSEAGVVLAGEEEFPLGHIALEGLSLGMERLTGYAGGIRDLRPGPWDREAAAPAALYARHVERLVVWGLEHLWDVTAWSGRVSVTLSTRALTRRCAMSDLDPKWSPTWGPMGTTRGSTSEVQSADLHEVEAADSRLSLESELWMAGGGKARSDWGAPLQLHNISSLAFMDTTIEDERIALARHSSV